MTSQTVDDAIRAAFDGNFIAAEDILQSGDVTVTIEAVIAPNTERDKGGKGRPIDKPILVMRGAKKRLVIGKTNLKVIAGLHGKASQEWIGKQITLTVRYLKDAFGQKNVPVVRVKTDESKMGYGARTKYGSPTPYAE